MAHLNLPFLVVEGSSAHRENSLHPGLGIAMDLRGIRIGIVKTVVNTTVLGRVMEYYHNINYYK